MDDPREKFDEAKQAAQEAVAALNALDPDKTVRWHVARITSVDRPPFSFTPDEYDGA